MQGVGRNKVRLLPHDEGWHAEFLTVRATIEKLWAGNVLDVQHIGSTAIAGICAKPILDVVVVLHNISAMDIGAMEGAGYEYRGPQRGDETCHLFVLRGEGEISLHHLHCYAPGNQNLQSCLAFRDYLNTHPEAARQYARLKQELAQAYPNDRLAYTNAKEAFILEICEKAAAR